MMDERDLLRVITKALLQYFPEDEWSEKVHATVSARNKALTTPLPDTDIKRILQDEEFKQRGRQLSTSPRSDKKLTPIWLDELLKLQTVEVEWLIEDLLPVGAIGVLSGDPASFKTWTLLHVATQVAIGGSVFGKFKTKQGKVLIIDEENQVQLLKGRLKQLGVTNGAVCFSTQIGFKIDKEEDMQALQDFVSTNDIQLVIMDSFVRVNSKDENVAREVAALFESLKSLTRSGVTVLLTHHHRKQTIGFKGASSQNLRGSSDILASVDTHIAVTRHKTSGKLIFDQNKSRHAKETPPFEVVVVDGQDGSVSLEYEGEIKKDPITKDQAKEAIVAQLGRGPATRAEVEAESFVGKSAVATALKELELEGVVHARVGAHGKKTYSLSDTDPQLDISI